MNPKTVFSKTKTIEVLKIYISTILWKELGQGPKLMLVLAKDVASLPKWFEVARHDTHDDVQSA
jgi:hypothetical protein